MTRILLDTNALVSFLTDRDEVQQQRVARILREAADGQTEVYLHQTVITEMVYVLSNLYEVELTDVAALMQDMLAMPGLLPIHGLAWSAVLDRWPDPYPDLADACLATVASQNPTMSIATFDRTLGKRLRGEGLSTVW